MTNTRGAEGERDHRLDNAKGVLIFLVVTGHLCETITGDWAVDSFRLVLTAIYAFHMPAFVFLAGTTAKTSRLGERVLTFAIYLLIFQPLYFLARLLAGEPFDWSWNIPFWILWFLLAMIVWQLTLPIVVAFPKASLTVSTVIGVAAGASPMIGYEFSASRILVFWPFFIAGHVFGAGLLRRLSTVRRGIGLALVLLCLMPILALYAAHIDQAWLYGSRGFDYLDVGDGRGVGIRLCLYVVAAVLIVALLLVLPEHQGVLAGIGRRSLSIYLLHGFAVILLGPVLSRLWDEGHVNGARLLCLVAAVLITLVLGRPAFDHGIRRPVAGIVGRITRPLRSVPATAGPGSNQVVGAQ